VSTLISRSETTAGSKETESVKKNTFATIFMCLMAGCAIENQDTDDHAATFDDSEQNSAKDARLSAEAAPVSTAASFTWHLDPSTIESCADFYPPFGCTRTVPPGQCPGVHEGQPCSIEDDQCILVSGQRFRVFLCH
jgi:hypothetical protein